MLLLVGAGLGACGEAEREIERASGTSTTTAGPVNTPDSTAFEAPLTGAAEVPDAGDPDGSGRAVVRIDLTKAEVCYELTVANIDPAQAAHIHQGAAGVAGGVLITLSPPTAAGSVTGCVTGDVNVLRAITTAPEGYYVNVHNAAYPNGAVRGQLRRT